MLTIEELKSLEMGDYVYIIHNRMNWSGYCQRIADFFGCDTRFDTVDGIITPEYEEYGKIWIAYKNKEEAEGKSITLPYLLCTSSKFACVIWREDGKVHKTYTMPIDEAKRALERKKQVK